MKIKLQEHHNLDESVESLTSMLRLFKERYGIEHFRDIQLSLTLMNEHGEDVEIIDANTSEVFDVFEVYKSKRESRRPNLRLAVDNTIH